METILVNVLAYGYIIGSIVIMYSFSFMLIDATVTHITDKHLGYWIRAGVKKAISKFWKR